MTTPENSCQRGLLIFHLHVLPHRTRTLLWILQKGRNMKSRSYTVPNYYINCFYGIRSSMRTNVILSSYRYHQISLCYSLYRHYNSTMIMRGLLCRQSNPNTILCLSLSIPIYNCSTSIDTPSVSTQKRGQKPNRTTKKLR